MTNCNSNELIQVLAWIKALRQGVEVFGEVLKQKRDRTSYAVRWRQWSILLSKKLSKDTTVVATYLCQS